MACPICPYCGDPLVEKASSRDHVFVDALGATATVRACRQCNSTLGHALEAKLLHHDQLLNLARLASGAGGAPVRGVLPDGRKVASDLRSPQLELQRPVRKNGDHLLVSGSDEQIRKQLVRMGLSPEQVEKAMAASVVETLGEQTLTITLQIDPVLWARLTAKIALGSGYAVAPEWFTNTELARNLRDICHGRVADYPPMASADMQQYTRIIEESIAHIVPRHHLVPLTDPEHHQMVFVPCEDRTICIASLGRTELFGIAVPGSIRGWTSMPVVITDNGTGSLEARYVEHDVRISLARRKPGQ